MDKILEASDIDLFQILEEDHAWYLLDNLQLSPGSYKLRNEKVLSETWDDIVYAKDLVIAGPDSFPTGSIFGMNIYEVTHKNTGKKVHITLGEIYK